jgi:hypothetical protein
LIDPEKCLVFAASCAEQADRAVDRINRKVWVDLTQRWLDLAADIDSVDEGRAPSVPIR